MQIRFVIMLHCTCQPFARTCIVHIHTHNQIEIWKFDKIHQTNITKNVNTNAHIVLATQTMLMPSEMDTAVCHKYMFVTYSIDVMYAMQMELCIHVFLFVSKLKTCMELSFVACCWLYTATVWHTSNDTCNDYLIIMLPFKYTHTHRHIESRMQT